MVAAFVVYFGAFSLIETPQRIEGEVRGILDDELVVAHSRELDRAYSVEQSAKISLNNGPVRLHDLAEGDEVALLVDPKGRVTEVLAARFPK